MGFLEDNFRELNLPALFLGKFVGEFGEGKMVKSLKGSQMRPFLNESFCKMQVKKCLCHLKSATTSFSVTFLPLIFIESQQDIEVY